MLCSFITSKECSGSLLIPNSKHRQFCPLIEEGKKDNNFLLMSLLPNDQIKWAVDIISNCLNRAPKKA